MQWFKENFLQGLEENQVVIVLDVGSQCVPGQADTYKVYFDEPQFQYIGLDMAEGYNVDIAVRNAYRWDEVPDDFCDVLISGQAFEHIEFPWFIVSEIARVLKPSGMVCIIAPSTAVLHRYPVHCQNYFSDGLIALAKYAGLEVIHASTNLAPEGADDEWYSRFQDSMIVARKPQNWKKDYFSQSNYKYEPTDMKKLATDLIPIHQQVRLDSICTVDINGDIRCIGDMLAANCFRTIFVIDSEKYLHGTITMGDFFRKAINAVTISELINTSFKKIDVCAPERDNYPRIREIAHRIFLDVQSIREIPILSSGKLIGSIKKS